MLDRANKSEPVGKKECATSDQSEQESLVGRLQCEAFGSAGCTVLAVARQRASGTEIIGMALARRNHRALEAH